MVKSLLVDNLSTHYLTEKGPVHAVQNVTFSINGAESIGIAGESACGKSTLGLSLMRTLQGGKVVSGKVLLDGKSLLDITDDEFNKHYRWKKISMIFQGAMNSLDPVYTVGQQFSDVLRQHHYEQNRDDAMAWALTSVGLSLDVLTRYPHELSGGMKQRAVIAMALLLKPDLVVADEPTTALDVLVQSQILNLFKDLKKQGVSFILISHDLATLSEVCEKLGIMYGGRMVEFGDTKDVLESPKHPYTQALLKSIPKMKSSEKPSYILGSPPSLLNPIPGCRFIDRCPHAMDKCRKDPMPTKTDSGYVECFLYE